jgi:hypothetical protein
MGYQKPSKLTNDKESKFLNLAYSDLEAVISRFDKVHPFVRQILLRDIASVVVKRCRQSFKNGIEIGMKRGQQGAEEA